MKKIIFTVLIVCFTGVASAQGITFQMGEKTNKKAYDTKMIRIVEGMQDGQLFVVEPELKAISGPKSNPVKSVKVRLCDREWNDTKSITLSDSKKSGIGDAFRSGNRLHVVISKNVDKKLVVRHVAFNAQSLEIVNDEPLVDIPIQKNDEAFVWTVASPNGQYHSVVYAVWSEKGESKVVAMLFDNNMKKLWEQRLFYSDVFNVIVTDNGMGMTKERLEQISDKINKVSDDDDIFGLNNINERIRLKFGSRYGIHIESVYGEGTTASVMLPYDPD